MTGLWRPRPHQVESATTTARAEDAAKDLTNEELVCGPEMTATEVQARAREFSRRVALVMDEAKEDFDDHLMETFHPIARGKLVGITGRARSGKDTLASGLNYAEGYVKLSFAAPLYDLVSDLVGIDKDELAASTELKETPHPLLGGKTPRYALQTLGTEWGRNMLGRSIWVDACLAKAERLLEAGKNVVITDIRLDNEAEAVLAAGGPVIRIFRAGPVISSSDHSSEAGIDEANVSFTIINDGTPTDLLRNALDIL